MRILFLALILACSIKAQVMQQGIINLKPAASAYTNCYPITVPDASISATLSSYPLLIRNPTGTVTTVTVAGSTTLTVATGDNFPAWFDNTMSVIVNGTIYPISSVTSTLIIVVTGTITNGTYSWNGLPQLSYNITGSKVLNSNGYDIGFFSDSGCTTKLNWETVYWTAATGVGEWWVQKTLTDGGATTLYIGYGATTITTDQSNKTGTWNSDYKIVHHWPNGSSLTSPTPDSTSNANDGTLTVAPTVVAGKIDGGATFTSATSIVTVASATSLNLTNNFTLEAWIKFGSTGQTNRFILDRAATGVQYGIIYGYTSNKYEFYSENFTGSNPRTAFGSTVNDTNFHHIAVTYNGTTLLCYLDGAQDCTSTTTFSITTATAGFYYADQSATNAPSAVYDETRMNNAAMSAAWIAADYNSQNSPFTFWSTTAH